MFGFIFSLLIGALAGYIAGRIMGSETSTVRNIVLGILGGFVGSIVFGLIGLSATGIVGEILVSVVGTVFAVGPAGLIVELCSQSGASGVLTSLLFWLIIILVYYFIATFISIDAVIGKIYPIFGICLIIMAVGVIVGIFTNPAYTIPEFWLT